MKKYFMSFVVMIMAAGLTAFAVTSKKVPADSKLTSLYWYAVTYNATYPNGIVMSSSDIRFGGAPQTQPYADANDGCSGVNKHCIRGFSSTLGSFPNTSAPVDVTTKN